MMKPLMGCQLFARSLPPALLTRGVFALAMISAGCARSTPDVLPSEPEPVSNASPEPVVPAKASRTVPAVISEDLWGFWVMDRDQTRTWLIMESPNIRVIIIDRKQKRAWCLDGSYALAKNGMVYGVMTRQDQERPEAERLEALIQGNDLALRTKLTAPADVQKPLPLAPFCCDFHPEGDDIILDRIEGTGIIQEQKQLFPGRYRKTALARPTFYRHSQPLGVWTRQLPGHFAQISLHVNSAELEVKINEPEGGRLSFKAEYQMAQRDVLFGLLTSMEKGQVGEPWQEIPLSPQPFCLRLVPLIEGLEIRDIQALDMDKNLRDKLLGDFRVPR